MLLTNLPVEDFATAQGSNALVSGTGGNCAVFPHPETELWVEDLR